VFAFHVLKLTARKGQNGHFWWTKNVQKNVQKRGGQNPSSILAFGRFERNIFDGFVFEI
jgi:hypothetical protein